MLGRILGINSAPQYQTSGESDGFTVAPDPPARGALYFSKTSATGQVQQTCMYTMCDAIVRPTASKFSCELSISRSDEDDHDGGDFPLDIVFPIDQQSNFICNEDQFAWSDRSGKRFNLDLDSDVSPSSLKDAIACALFLNIHSKMPGPDNQQELDDLLASTEHEDNDRLIPQGELLRVEAVLFKYDVDSNQFVSSGANDRIIVTINSAVVKEDNSTAFLMMIIDAKSSERIMDIEISNALNAQFYAKTLSMIWVMNLDGSVDGPEDDGKEYDVEKNVCLSAKVASAQDFVSLRNQFSVCLYEVNHGASYEDLKLKQEDIAFIEDSARDDVEPMEIDETVDEEEEEERNVRDANPTEGNISDDEDGMHNSHLAIASNHDRTFVVRGTKMGVFETGDEGAKLKTTVKFKNPQSGNTFTPSKVLLHERDKSMLLLDPTDDTRVMRMDMERGEIVDCWDGGFTANTPVKTVHKVSKYSNLTDQQEFVGVNKNQLLRMDPRTSEFIVQSKKYAASTKAKLDCVATTGAGYLAVASENGDVRLFDQIGKNAKTHLPGISGSIVGIDVTEDGFYVLVTTPKYLLVIDTRVMGREKGGFLQSMGKHKPAPRKLTIKNEHIAKHRMGELNFTTAHFNTGSSLERSIVTSTGPFIVIWNFRQVKSGKLDCYKIKRYMDTVVADDFAFNNDGRIVVTMPDDVSVATR